MAHAAAKTIVTVEKIYDGDLIDDPTLAAGASAGLLRRADRGRRARRMAPRPARPLRARSGASRRIRAHGGDAGRLCRVSRSLRPCPPRRVTFATRSCSPTSSPRLIGDAATSRSATPRRSPRPPRCWRASGRGTPYVSLLGSRKHTVLDRRRARAVRLRRPGPHRRVLPVGRPDRRPRQRQPGLDRRLRASQGALSRLVRLRPSLLRGAEGDPVPHRALAPHARRPRSISSARRARANRTFIGPAARSR